MPQRQKYFKGEEGVENLFRPSGVILPLMKIFLLL
jgi:hypothetical protein